VHYILAEIAPHVGCPVEVIGIIRPYMTRHGAGPLPTETDATNIWHNHELNVSNKWQEYFRLGWPDLVLWRYAIDVCKPVLPITALAVTCLDTLNHQFLKVCNGYKYRDTGQHFGTIVPSNEKNLDKQFNLTQLLCNGIDPCYGGDVMDSKEFNMTIEANLECPVTYKSFGPDVSQKTTL
jgi:adenylosuccinate synthase